MNVLPVWRMNFPGKKFECYWISFLSGHSKKDNSVYWPLHINGSPAEQALAGRIDTLWREVDWNFYRRNDQNVLYWHWSPEYGWEMNFPVHGYNECLIMYILAAASPTHSIPATVYHEGWAEKGAIVDPHKVEDIELHLRYQGCEAGPLFWAHYSFPRTGPDKFI